MLILFFSKKIKLCPGDYLYSTSKRFCFIVSNFLNFLSQSSKNELQRNAGLPGLGFSVMQDYAETRFQCNAELCGQGFSIMQNYADRVSA